MNCQHESEHDGQKQAANAEQQPMEILDYLHLASFIHYQHNGAAHAHSPADAGVLEG